LWKKGLAFSFRLCYKDRIAELDMILDTIYKKDVTGSIRIWYAEIGEGPLEGHWRTISGLLNGEKVASEWKFSVPKSQFNSQEQAIFEANAARFKRLRIDYRESIDDVDEKRRSFIKPMLAHSYQGWQGVCFSQPKLDGMRCIANCDGLWSRLNNKIISTPHIEAQLEYFFDKYPNIILDGELYSLNLNDNFNTIMSLTKKTKPTMEDLDRSERIIEYWVYDMYDQQHPDLRFEERFNFLKKVLFPHMKSSKIIEVKTIKITTEEDLNLNFIELLEEGFEGQMIRFNVPYEQRRTSAILKRKEMQDQEFKLIDIEEGKGNWSGYAKIAICETIEGKRFGAGISGTQEFNYMLLKEKHKYQSVTVKYQALTPDGIPRFGVAIKFYENEFDALEERIQPRKDLFG
jgi:DNA ligase 1